MLQIAGRKSAFLCTFFFTIEIKNHITNIKKIIHKMKAYHLFIDTVKGYIKLWWYNIGALFFLQHRSTVNHWFLILKISTQRVLKAVIWTHIPSGKILKNIY